MYPERILISNCVCVVLCATLASVSAAINDAYCSRAACTGTAFLPVDAIMVAVYVAAGALALACCWGYAWTLRRAEEPHPEFQAAALGAFLGSFNTFLFLVGSFGNAFAVPVDAPDNPWPFNLALLGAEALCWIAQLVSFRYLLA